MEPFDTVSSERDWNTLDFGDWRPVELECPGLGFERDTLIIMEAQRLGEILHAWVLEVEDSEDSPWDGTETEADESVDCQVIEHWLLTFLDAGTGLYKERDGCYYRYRLADSGRGFVYRALEDALIESRGQQISDVLPGTLALGLILPGDLFRN